MGVIFFLYRLKDIVQYVSLFTLGHSITLLAGVLGGFHANPYVIDAIIGFSVVYKAFDNMDGFRRFLGFEPNTKVAVLIFGLFHGFGLATKLQELDLSKNGLITNIVSFNVGVEIGQVLALTAVLIALSVWRTQSGFLRAGFHGERGADDGWIHSGWIPGRRLFRSGVREHMIEQQDLQQVLAPSKKAIAKATGIALAVALVILFTAVLPAEYGIDPLKTGKLLHLTDLAKATNRRPSRKPPLALGP